MRFRRQCCSVYALTVPARPRGDLADELTAGGGDVVTAGLARHRDQARADEALQVLASALQEVDGSLRGVAGVAALIGDATAADAIGALNFLSRPCF